MQDTCAYHEDFTKEKLLWIELVNSGRFAYDNSGLYGEATTFLLTGESIKYPLCGAECKTNSLVPREGGPDFRDGDVALEEGLC